MIEAAEAVAEFLKDRKRVDFDTDRMLLFAVIRAVEVFGEAAAKMSLTTKSAAVGIPWPQIIAVRNRLIHAYFDIDREILWRAATEELPGLLPTLRELVASEA
jgi:uncharacterized protein with HEPN domain